MKGPVFIHLRVKFSIQNIVLRVSRRKISKTFSCEASFFVFLMNRLLACPSFTSPTLSALKRFWLHAPAPRHCSFCRTPHLKCLTVF